MINSYKLESALPLFSLPTTQTTREIITPHKLSILFLIQEYLAFRRMETITAKYRRQFSLLLLKLIQYPDMSYKDLHQHLTSATYGISQPHLDGFDKVMKLFTQVGIEVLFDVQNLMNKVMSENAASNGCVSQFGIVGLYVRQIHVTLEKMSFPEVMALYKCTMAYYEKGIRAIFISSEIDFDEDKTCVIKADRPPGSCSKWSLKQSELFVVRQCTLLTSSETEALNPKMLDNKLKVIAKDNPSYPQADFLKYVNNLRVRDFQNTIDALHCSFDRNLLKLLVLQDSKGFQYSSLNLAILHASFGYKKEALASLRECIMLAQECGDRVCLQFAQSWWYYLDKSQIKLNEIMVAIKSENDLVDSISLGIQFIAKRTALSGYCPARLFDLLLKSDLLNCQHSAINLIANCMAEKAAIWTLYGKNEIGSLNGQLLLNSNLQILGNMNNGEGNCHALCCLANWLTLQGEYALCSAVIGHAKKCFSRQPLLNYWLTCFYLSHSTLFILQQNWTDGIEAITALYTFNNSLAILQLASLNIAKTNFSFAETILQLFLERSELDYLTRVRAMILLAFALLTPQGLSSQVIEVLTNSINIAKSKYFSYELATLQMIYAYVLLQFQLPRQALKVIKESYEVILSNGGLYEKARCMFLHTKCFIAAASDTDEKLRKLTDSLVTLQKCVDYFTKVGNYPKVKDIYIYLATFYHQFDLVAERNLYAHKLQKIEEQYPTPAEYLNVFF